MSCINSFHKWKDQLVNIAVYATELPKSSKGNGCQKSAEFLRGRLLIIESHILCEIRLLKTEFFLSGISGLRYSNYVVVLQYSELPLIYSFIKEVCANEANLKTRILNL